MWTFIHVHQKDKKGFVRLTFVATNSAFPLLPDNILRQSEYQCESH